MKVKVEIDEKIAEPEIRISGNFADVVKIQEMLTGEFSRKLELFAKGEVHFVPTEDVIFFESVDGKTWAHTVREIYEAHEKLYELEEDLPRYFARISKSVIANTREISSIAKNIAGPSVVRFRETEKRTTASRSFYKILIEKMKAENF